VDEPAGHEAQDPLRDLHPEGVTDAYVCRLLPLTCLAPDIVEAILDGRQPRSLKLAEVLWNGPLAWEEQRMGLGVRRLTPACSERCSTAVIQCRAF
jgi:hypothetical protein